MSTRVEPEVGNIELTTIDGTTTTLNALDKRAIMVVNVASKCGLTPQYSELEQLQEKYGERGFTVVGFPCNQFMGQEPGTSDEIATFCSATYGVTFPMMEKLKVNGRNQHPLYTALTKVPDSNGKAGRVQWNFEKFLIDSDFNVTRIRPRTVPSDPTVIAAIEDALA